MSFVGLQPEPVSDASTPPNQVDPSRADGGGPSAAPAARARGRFARLVARARSSVWAPVALKSSGIALGLLALAGIGAASILSNARGVAFAASLPHRANRHGDWLAAAPPHEYHAARRASRRSRAAASAGSAPADAGATADAAPSGITPDGKVILNVASAEELTRLPGVGAKRAQSILALRHRLKRFRRASQLLRVRGIGVKSLKRILPHLVLDPPRAARDAG